MNPHYNQQQQPYYNYQQNIPGPPQPSWQSQVPQAPGGWGDPRFSQRPQSPGSFQNNFAPIPGPTSQYPSPPPPPPPSTGLPPSVQQPPLRPQDSFHGPSAGQYDSTGWGVKYNHGQPNQYYHDPQQPYQQDAKPALPPRPTSSLSHTSLNSHQSHQSQHQHHPSLGDFQQTPTQYQSQGSWGAPFGQSQEHIPPTPPPRPAAYAIPSPYGQSGLSSEQYSHHAATHHYDPQAHPQSGWQQTPHPPPVSAPPFTQQHIPSSAASTWSSSQHTTDTPVSPLEDESRRTSLITRPSTIFVDAEPPSQNLQLPTPAPTSAPAPPVTPQPSSAALPMFGGPSDWQHYEPVSLFEPAKEQELPTSTPPQQPAVASPLQPKHSIKRKSIERIRPSSKASMQLPPVQSLDEAVNNQQVQKPDLKSASSQSSSQPPMSFMHGLERQDSGQSNGSSVGGIDRSDTIDNIIKAWKAPMKVDSAVQTSLPPTRTPSQKDPKPVVPKIETFDKQIQTDFKPIVETRVETRIETKEVKVEVDPYADIQNQYRATLNRFASMLRQEADTEHDEEKFKIFQGFIIRELRLRSVLYGVEAHTHDPPPLPPPPQAVLKVEGKADKDLVSTPASVAMTEPTATTASVPQIPEQKAPASHALPSETPLQVQPPIPPKPTVIDTRSVETPKTPIRKPVPSGNSNFDENNEDGDYSPGGRPRMSPLRVKTFKTADSMQENGIMPHPASGRISPGANAPMTLDDYTMQDQPSPSANAPMVVDIDSALAGPVSTEITGPLNFQPARPLYTPFRYSEGPNGSAPATQPQSPPAESFAALRQTNATESGRALVHEPPPTNNLTAPGRGQSKTPSGRREHEEAFIGLIRAKSMAIRKVQNATPRPESPAILRAGTPAARSASSPAPVSPLFKSVQSLRSLVPKSLPPIPSEKLAVHPKLDPIVTPAQMVSDDFGFIHARVIGWDQENRKVRAKHDMERQARQSQNEERIDELFNDNEIGYADIGELERDFKLEEAGKKYREDQDEFESFNRGVFDFVVEKIDGDIKELTRLQTFAIDLLDLESESACKQIQNVSSQAAGGSNVSSNATISAIMQSLLLIHDKLELRHMKVAEAKFERERRRKRLELSILYTNNDKSGIRKLEAEFTTAEKLQVLEESRKKAERANRLMDSFDRAVVRGLAENQGVVDDVSTRLQLLRDLMMGSDDNLPSGAAREDLLYGSDGIKVLVDQAAAMVDFLHDDSKTLLQLFEKADNLSNNADFELYVSEAKLADASPERFQKLKTEKEVEDRSVTEELNNRLSGVARVPDEISALIREVRNQIGTDAGHEERIGKALEAAKKRNHSVSS